MTLDLRGVRCPLTWARTKVRIEPLARGALVAILLDDPQSARDLPRAAESEGHHVIAVDSLDDGWRVRLEV